MGYLIKESLCSFNLFQWSWCMELGDSGGAGGLTTLVKRHWSQVAIKELHDSPKIRRHAETGSVAAVLTSTRIWSRQVGNCESKNTETRGGTASVHQHNSTERAGSELSPKHDISHSLAPAPFNLFPTSDVSVSDHTVSIRPGHLRSAALTSPHLGFI